MYIRKFLLASYIVSFCLGITFVYRNKILYLIDDFGIKETLFSNNQDNILLELYISRINLREDVYTIDSSLNNVDYHVQILEGSNIEKNLFFLAAHSGSGYASYFDNLVYLEKGDIIWINIDKRKHVFIVDETFYIQKNGYFDNVYEDKDILFLITCSLKYVDKQLVVKSKLIYKC